MIRRFVRAVPIVVAAIPLAGGLAALAAPAAKFPWCAEAESCALGRPADLVCVAGASVTTRGDIRDGP